MKTKIWIFELLSHFQFEIMPELIETLDDEVLDSDVDSDLEIIENDEMDRDVEEPLPACDPTPKATPVVDKHVLKIILRKRRGAALMADYNIENCVKEEKKVYEFDSPVSGSDYSATSGSEYIQKGDEYTSDDDDEKSEFKKRKLSNNRVSYSYRKHTWM